MSKLQRGVWKAKGCNDITYALVQREDKNYNAYCCETGRVHLIKKDDCKNFLDNHYCLKNKERK